MNNVNYYISSNGDKIDITKVETTHLINALAKHHKTIYEASNVNEFVFHSDQISLIDGELLRRNKEFYDKKIGGGLWQQ